MVARKEQQTTLFCIITAVLTVEGMTFVSTLWYSDDVSDDDGQPIKIKDRSVYLFSSHCRGHKAHIPVLPALKISRGGCE